MEGGLGVPLFIQIAETIKRRILEAEYPVGSFIPAAWELEKEFKASNITIRKALNRLVQEGYLVPKRGLGTQVAQRQDERVEISLTGDFRSWIHTASGRKHRMGVKILEQDIVVCPHRIRNILGLPENEKIWRMKRIRTIKGRPISYFVNFASPELAIKIRTDDILQRSFIEAFQESCGIKLSKMRQRVQAIIADIDLSRALEVDFGAPLFFVETTYFAQDRPVEVTDMYFRADRYVYIAMQSF